MGRPTKTDEISERVEYSGKIFIYLSQWKILYPVIDIVRALPKHTIITYKYGKGQDIIKTYGSQYNHNTFGVDLVQSKEYISELYHGKVQTVFIYSDVSDNVSKNLLLFTEKFKINTVCYSTFDKKYHFYDYTTCIVENDIGSSTGKCIRTVYDTPEDVIEKMNDLNELKSLKKINDLFPEFEIFEEIETKRESVLEDCVKKLKILSFQEKEKQDNSKIKVAFDPHLFKIKREEYIRQQKKIVYDDETQKPKNILSGLFKKKLTKIKAED